eukprot:243313-Hanusia_phi.AAC.3
MQEFTGLDLFSGKAYPASDETKQCFSTQPYGSSNGRPGAAGSYSGFQHVSCFHWHLNEAQPAPLPIIALHTLNMYPRKRFSL